MVEARLLVVCNSRSRSNGLNLECRKFHTNMQKSFTVRVVEHRNRLPRLVVESPMEIRKTGVSTYVTCCRVSALAGSLVLISRNPFHPLRFCKPLLVTNKMFQVRFDFIL